MGAWVNVGPFCRLVYNDGLAVDLPGAKSIPVQFARDTGATDMAGDLTFNPKEVAIIPIDVTWNKTAAVKSSTKYAADLMALGKKWRTANGGKKPKHILFYGGFAQSQPWVDDFKDFLGYNTNLPDRFEQIKPAYIPQPFGTAKAIEDLAKNMKPEQKARVRAISLGDEISLGEINFADAKNNETFSAWLKSKGLTAKELGVDPAAAKLTKDGDPRLVWYSNLFNEEQRFAEFRSVTQVAKQQFGPAVMTGANYSPHHLALCYGPIFQWVDVFKHNGMSMFWAEDYIFSVPEAPQMLSWMFGQMRCGAKYNQQPIHFYVMPHAPGQEPGFLRRNMVMSVGYGARQIDSFGVSPEEQHTENYVAWTYPDTFRVIRESIFDSAEAETLQANGKVRPARVALITGKATDFNESRLLLDKSKDPFASRCQNAPAKVNQILCRKEQQLLYLALRHAQHAVDLVTEDDIVELDVLKNYDVVSGRRMGGPSPIPKLDAWVNGGGVLYASAGVCHLNEFNRPNPRCWLLGLRRHHGKNAVLSHASGTAAHGANRHHYNAGQKSPPLR